MSGQALWRRVDVLLALFVTGAMLAASLVLTLTLSGAGLGPLLALVVTVCSRTLREPLAHRAELGRLFLFVPLGAGLTVAGIEAAHLMLATRRWTASLAPLQCAPTGRLRRLTRRCGLAQNTILVRTDRLLVFTHGLLKPKVWLSTGLTRALTDDELEAVLRHEVYHLRARDPLKILAARCLSRALFFAPVARDLCDTYSVAKELSADAYATRVMGDALPLARALRKLLATCSPPALSAALISEAGITEARLFLLLSLSCQRQGICHPLPNVRHLLCLGRGECNGFEFSCTFSRTRRSTGVRG